MRDRYAYELLVVLTVRDEWRCGDGSQECYRQDWRPRRLCHLSFIKLPIQCQYSSEDAPIFVVGGQSDADERRPSYSEGHRGGVVQEVEVRARARREADKQDVRGDLSIKATTEFPGHDL